MILAFILAGMLAAAPVWLARERVREAETQLADLQRRVAPQVEAKERLARIAALVSSIEQGTDSGMPAVMVLDRLTRAVPDDAIVRRMMLDGHTVRIAGVAKDASQLLQTLGKEAAFHEVRSPGAITRNELTGKEAFAIEFDLVDGGSR